MKLHDPAFVRATQRLVKAECRAQPALRRAVRRNRTSWRTRAFSVWSIRWLWGLLPAALIGITQDSGWAVATAPVLAAWWFLEVIILGRGVVVNHALDLPPALLTLPFAPDAFARLARARVLSLLWRPFWDGLAILVVLAATHQAGPAGWLAVPLLAALNAAAVWGAVLLLTRCPVPQALTLFMYLLPFAVLIFHKTGWLMHWLRETLTTQATWLTLLSPGGWTTALFLAGLGPLSAWWWLALVPLLALAACAPQFLRTMMRQIAPERHLLEEWLGAEAFEPTDAEAPPEAPEAAAPEPSAAEWRDAWAAARLDDNESGWMEQFFFRRLQPRERLVLECIANRLPPWTRWTWRSLQLLTVALLIMLLLPLLPAGLHMLFIIAAVVLAVLGLCFGLPLASGFDELASRVVLYGMSLARPAVYPLNPWEFVRLTRKAAALRALVMLPALLLVGGLVALLLHKPPAALVLLGLKLSLISAAAAPFLCAMALSAVTNDSQTPGLRGLRAVGLIIFFALLLVGLGLSALFAPVVWSALLLPAFALAAHLGAYLYVRSYNRGGFDFLQRARQ